MSRRRSRRRHARPLLAALLAGALLVAAVPAATDAAAHGAATVSVVRLLAARTATVKRADGGVAVLLPTTMPLPRPDYTASGANPGRYRLEIDGPSRAAVPTSACSRFSPACAGDGGMAHRSD